MAVVDSAETWDGGVLIERRALNDDGTVSVFNGAGQQTSTIPATPTSLARVAAALARVAATAQDASFAPLLTQAQNLLDSLATRRAAIITGGQTLAAARSTFNTARTAYLALGTPTLAQVDTYLTAQAAYVLVLDNSIVANGTDAIADIDDLSNVVKRLANLVAKLQGSTTVIT